MVCRHCGSSSNPGARFCKTCGVSLAPLAVADASASAVGGAAGGHGAAGHAIGKTAVSAPAQRKGFEWVWPAVDTPESARFAVRQAFWAAIFVCGATTLVVLISAVAAPTDPRLQFAPSALVDAAIFGAIAFGIWKESRAAAVAGLTVYLLEQLYMLTQLAGRPPNFILMAILICGFLGGIRGTWALHDMRARGLHTS